MTPDRQAAINTAHWMVMTQLFPQNAYEIKNLMAVLGYEQPYPVTIREAVKEILSKERERK